MNILTSRTAQFAATPLAVAIPINPSGMTADMLVDIITVAGKSDNADDGIVELRVLAQGYSADSAEYTDTVYEALAEARIWNKYHAG